MRSFFANKKASTSDIAFIAIIIFALVIVVPLGFLIIDNINTAFQGNEQIPQQARDTISEFNTDFPAWADGLFLLVWMGLFGVALFFASRIDVNPALFFFSFFILLVLGLLAAALGNAYSTYAANPAISTYTNQLPIITFVWENIVMVLLIQAAILGIVVFAKIQSA